MTRTLSAPEIRTQSLDLDTQALVYDSRVRELESNYKMLWSEVSALCILFRDRELWKLLPPRLTLDLIGQSVMLPFHSFDEWLLEAAPCCRATIYRGMGILSTLSKDMLPEDIAGIEIGNAAVMAQLSSKIRLDPEIIEAAKDSRHTKKLRETIRRKYANQHVEMIVERKCRFEQSQWEVIEPKFEAWQVAYPNGRFEEFVEFLCSEAE